VILKAPGDLELVNLRGAAQFSEGLRPWRFATRGGTGSGQGHTSRRGAPETGANGEVICNLDGRRKRDALCPDRVARSTVEGGGDERVWPAVFCPIGC
jgi:hypothetical protein